MSRQNSVERRVFVVGSPRSGTTLVQAMLAAHPRIHSVPETQFFVAAVGATEERLFGAKPPPPWVPYLRRARRLFGTSWSGRGQLHSLLDAVGRSDLKRQFAHRSWSLDGETRAFVELLDQLTIEAECDIWVEKSPNHVAYVDEIQRLVPSPHFIHVVRRGRDVIASLRDLAVRNPEGSWGKSYPTLERCVDAWLAAVGHTLRAQQYPNHHVLRHAALVDSPESELRAVCAFLGISFDPAMLNQFGAQLEQISIPEENWKTDVNGPLVDRSKFETVLTRAEQKYVLERLANAPPAIQSLVVD